jgi:hypothetical protein
MTWSEVREKFPEEWLLIEALQAHSEDNKRILDIIGVMGEYQDFASAMVLYKKIHRAQPQREMYIVHTMREELDITERFWSGVRRVQALV